MIELQPGDIIGMRSDNLIGHVINLGTFGSLARGISHIGIVAPADDNRDQLLIYESTTLSGCDCYYHKKAVSGVQASRPRERFAAYQGKIWVYRLTQPLTETEVHRLTKFLRHHVGTEYDYLGAFKARGSNWITRRILPKSGLDLIFCSEYVAAALQCLERVDLAYGKGWNPNRLRGYVFDMNIARLVGRVKPPVPPPPGCF
jgi:hypothetical protein